MTTATATRRSALGRRSLAADTMTLEKLLREGPPDGDIEGALESTRLKILDQGIRSDTDGMVSNVEYPGKLGMGGYERGGSQVWD